jgi:hypothetical protein
VTDKDKAEKLTEPESDSHSNCSEEKVGSSGVRKSKGLKTCRCMGGLRQSLTLPPKVVLHKTMDASGVEQQKTKLDIFEQFP